jgi:hypothetical protein
MIFLTALYQYAALEEVPAGFSERALSRAFRSRK